MFAFKVYNYGKWTHFEFFFINIIYQTVLCADDRYKSLTFIIKCLTCFKNYKIIITDLKYLSTHSLVIIYAYLFSNYIDIQIS